MTSTSDRPLLLLDVDGPLNPFMAKPTKRPDGFTTHRMRPPGWMQRGSLRVWLHPDHGRQLLEFAESAGLELVWATTWEDLANTMIGPRIGLPELPVIKCDSDGKYWKFEAVAAYAQWRPLAWLDDDFKLHPRARTWFEQQRRDSDMPTLLHQVDPRTGFTAADLDAVATWAASLSR